MTPSSQAVIAVAVVADEVEIEQAIGADIAIAAVAIGAVTGAVVGVATETTVGEEIDADADIAKIDDWVGAVAAVLASAAVCIVAADHAVEDVEINADIVGIDRRCQCCRRSPPVLSQSGVEPVTISRSTQTLPVPINDGSFSPLSSTTQLESSLSDCSFNTDIAKIDNAIEAVERAVVRAIAGDGVEHIVNNVGHITRSVAFGVITDDDINDAIDIDHRIVIIGVCVATDDGVDRSVDIDY